MRGAAVDVGTVLREHADRLGVILGRGPDQRALAVKLVASLGVGAVLEQQTQRCG